MITLNEQAMNRIVKLLWKWKTNRMIGTGVFLLRLGEYDKALAKLDKVIERDPESHMAWTGKGLTLAKLKRYHEAIEAYEKALRLGPPPKEREQLRGLLKGARENLKNP